MVCFFAPTRTAFVRLVICCSSTASPREVCVYLKHAIRSIKTGGGSPSCCSCLEADLPTRAMGITDVTMNATVRMAVYLDYHCGQLALQGACVTPEYEQPGHFSAMASSHSLTNDSSSRAHIAWSPPAWHRALTHKQTIARRHSEKQSLASSSCC
jgi:hypothetical protein